HRATHPRFARRPPRPRHARPGPRRRQWAQGAGAPVPAADRRRRRRRGADRDFVHRGEQSGLADGGARGPGRGDGLPAQPAVPLSGVYRSVWRGWGTRTGTMTENDQKQLGKTLWAIADQLRGSMNADDFRDYMLSFLFLRYLSDNYEAAARRELGADYPDRDAIGNGGRTPLSVWYADNPGDVAQFEQQM